jgi:hypothetical protein
LPNNFQKRAGAEQGLTELQPPAARFPRGDGCPGSLESNGIFKGGSNAND